MENRTVTITLQVEVHGDEVNGRASDGAAATRDFSGWLGLVGAIDALLGFPPDAGATARAFARQEGAETR
jgi:hypothetical protein